MNNNTQEEEESPLLALLRIPQKGAKDPLRDIRNYLHRFFTLADYVKFFDRKFFPSFFLQEFFWRNVVFLCDEDVVHNTSKITTLKLRHTFTFLNGLPHGEYKTYFVKKNNNNNTFSNFIEFNGFPHGEEEYKEHWNNNERAEINTLHKKYADGEKNTLHELYKKYYKDEKPFKIYFNYENGELREYREFYSYKYDEHHEEYVNKNKINIRLHYFKDKKKKDGQYKEYFEDGKTLAIRCFFDEHFKLHGEYKDWHTDGTLKKLCNFKHGVLQGEYKEYWKNGYLYKHCFFENGKYHGPFKQYTKDATTTLYISCSYEHGKLHGEFIYYKNEQKTMFEYLVNLLKPYKCFYQNGRRLLLQKGQKHPLVNWTEYLENMTGPYW